MPADIVCFLGQHNTLAGDKKLRQMFFYDELLPYEPEVIPCTLSAGEFVITPGRLVGRYDCSLTDCQKHVDDWIHSQRRLHRQTLAKLPPPKHSAADLKRGKRR